MSRVEEDEQLLTDATKKFHELIAQKKFEGIDFDKLQDKIKELSLELAHMEEEE